MEKKDHKPKQDKALRKRAEELLKERSKSSEPFSIDDSEALIHELRVHQIELEMQNDELRSAQLELSESRDRYIELYDYAPVGYVSLTPKNIIVGANLTLCTMLGIERNSLIKQPFSKIILRGDQDAFYLTRRKLIDSKAKQICELKLLKADGTSFYASLECRPQLDADENITQIRIALTDITERKKAEEEKEKDYMNKIGVMVVAINIDGSVDFINKSGCEFLGYKSEEIIGKNWFEDFILHCGKENKDGVVCKILNGCKDSVEGCEREVRTKSGVIRMISWNCVPILDVNGKVTGVISTGEDITDQKKSEEEKKKLWNQLLQSQKLESIGRLTGGIAHDFNNILTTTIGFSSIAYEKMSDDNPLKEMIEKVHNSGERAAKLINQLMMFSCKQVLEMMPININDSVNAIIDMIKSTIGENIKIDLELDKGLNNIMGDETQVEQVLMNLVVNARDAMPKGGSIKIKSQNIIIGNELTHVTPELTAGDYVELSIMDTGHGMSDEIRERIFDPFFTSKEIGKGTGLGLSTVFGIVKQHKGAILVESVIGKGTEYKIYFPVTKVKTQLKAREVIKEVSGGKETIMVVEDNPDVRLLFTTILKPLGYNIIEAESAESALKAIQSHEGRIDLLLTDLLLPGMDGFDLYQDISKVHPDTKVLFVSGFIEDSVVLKELQNGNFPYLKKPLDTRELSITVREILDNKLKYLSNI
jgi:PAS domain S-box-containing protein